MKELVELKWYYSPEEIVKEVNKERLENGISSCHIIEVKDVIDYLKSGKDFLELESSVGSYYCMKEKKQVLTFSVYSKDSKLVKRQIKGLFDFILSELGHGKKVDKQDIKNQAYFLCDFYVKNKCRENLEDKLPKKEKASSKKPKI